MSRRPENPGDGEQFPDCSFEGTRAWHRERAQKMSDLEKIRWLEETMEELGPLVGVLRKRGDRQERT